MGDDANETKERKSIRFTCPECCFSYRVAASMLNKRVKCAKCDEVVVIKSRDAAMRKDPGANAGMTVAKLNRVVQEYGFIRTRLRQVVPVVALLLLVGAIMTLPIALELLSALGGENRGQAGRLILGILLHLGQLAIGFLCLMRLYEYSNSISDLEEHHSPDEVATTVSRGRKVWDALAYLAILALVSVLIALLTLYWTSLSDIFKWNG